MAGGFDTHVRQQLPWYDLVTSSVEAIARHYVPRGGTVLDIGAATGNIGRALSPLLSAREAALVAVEPSAEMRARYRETGAPGRLVASSIEDMEIPPFDVAVSFLTLIFVGIAQRRAVIERLRSAMRPGGALILVEKVEPAKGYAGTVLYRMTLDGKRRAGARDQDILDKELALSGVQRPLRREEIPVGAAEFFRFGDFAGFVIDA